MSHHHHNSWPGPVKLPATIRSEPDDSCHFGWGLIHGQPKEPPAPQSSPGQHRDEEPSYYQRLRPCTNKFYHQLTCGHRIRTTLIEVCAENCLEPFDNGPTNGRFYCKDCEEQSSKKYKRDLESKYQAIYCSPEYMLMSKDQQEEIAIAHYQERLHYDSMFEEAKRQEMACTRECIACPILEPKGEAVNMAMDLDSLSISQTEESRTSSASPPQMPTTRRIDLPTDPSQQLHFQLNGLSLSSYGRE